MKSPTGYIELKRIEAERLAERLVATQEMRLSTLRRSFVAYAASLDALSPLKVLARGYAVPSGDDGKVLKSAENVQIGDKIDLTLADGKLLCKVEGKTKGE